MTHIRLCVQLTVGVYTTKDAKLSDQRTFQVVSRAANVSAVSVAPEWDYKQPYRLTVVDSQKTPVHVVTFTASSQSSSSAFPLCYYIVG